MKMLCLLLFLGSALLLRAGPPSIPENLISMQAKYTIKHGDTLARIANRHKVSVSYIWTINNGNLYNPNKIYSGQMINVPSQEAIEIIEKESKKLQAIVKKLGAVKYPVRKLAMLALINLDWKTVPILLEALKHKDPEVRENARTILRTFHQRAEKLH